MFSCIGWLVIGGLAGWLASLVMGTNRQQGLMTDIILGIVGAFIGGGVLSLLGMGEGFGYQGFDLMSLVSAFVGAVIVLFVGKTLMGRRR